MLQDGAGNGCRRTHRAIKKAPAGASKAQPSTSGVTGLFVSYPMTPVAETPPCDVGHNCMKQGQKYYARPVRALYRMPWYP